MDLIIITELLVALLIGIYSVGVLIVWIYELRKNALYSEMQSRVKFLESLRLSSALMHAKMYKVKEDYRRSCEVIEGAQQFFANMLFMDRQNKQKKFSCIK